MNTIIITVAGTATRFNKDTTSNTLKCLYYENSPQETLLYGILEKSKDDDQFVIVGGYLYEHLKEYISLHCARFADRIRVVYNEKFDTYGSGYSLILGIENLPKNTSSVTFVEGDLFFDKTSYHKL
ncbi:MAG: licC domain protein, partial [Mucinivorans sp.]